MEGVATELLYRATLTSLFATNTTSSVNKQLIQIKNGFALSLIPLNATFSGKRK